MLRIHFRIRIRDRIRPFDVKICKIFALNFRYGQKVIDFYTCMHIPLENLINPLKVLLHSYSVYTENLSIVKWLSFFFKYGLRSVKK